MIFIFLRANKLKKMQRCRQRTIWLLWYPKRNFYAEISQKSQFSNCLSLAIEVTLSALVMKTTLLAYLCHSGYLFLHLFLLLKSLLCLCHNRSHEVPSPRSTWSRNVVSCLEKVFTRRERECPHIPQSERMLLQLCSLWLWLQLALLQHRVKA
jgi:membrane protein required for beta-lactamase induction